MALTKLIVISLILTVSVLSGVRAITKDECFTVCTQQYNTMSGSPNRELVFTKCKQSCLTLGSSSVASKTPAQCSMTCSAQVSKLTALSQAARQTELAGCLSRCLTAKPTSNVKKGTPSLASKSVSLTLTQCEGRCEDQKNHLQAMGTHSVLFVNKVFLECSAICVKKVSQTTVEEKCKAWVNKLNALYVADKQTQEFLQLLNQRALQACSA